MRIKALCLAAASNLGHGFQHDRSACQLSVLLWPNLKEWHIVLRGALAISVVDLRHTTSALCHFPQLLIVVSCAYACAHALA